MHLPITAVLIILVQRRCSRVDSERLSAVAASHMIAK